MKRLALVAAVLLLACHSAGAGSDDASSSATPTPSPLPSPAGATTEIAAFGTNPGGLQMFLYDPGNLTSAAPVVVALHGCTQNASDYAAAGWNALADADGFYVVYPQTTANTDCFAYWDPAQARRDLGEAASIAQMVEWMKTNHAIDPARVFVTGLSAGGGMTAVMAATYPEIFDGAAIMSGIPYRCADDFTTALSCATSAHGKTATEWGDLVRAAAPGFSGHWPRVSIWQGADDGVVVPPNSDELVLQWTNVLSLSSTPSATQTIGAATRELYRGTATDLVERWTISGMGHGTAVDSTENCGTAGQYFPDVGLCSSQYAAKWFGLE